MGSYLSVYNNTSEVYQVKVGPDEAALKIATIVLAVVGAVAAILTTAGLGAGFSAALVANGVVEVFGVSTSTLAAITSLASTIAGYTIAADALGFAVSMTTFITNKLQKEEGYVEIKPGNKQSFGKYTLSLWRQACCRRVRPNPSNSQEVLMDELYMRPIFTGATDGSTLEHNVMYWIEKWGHENEQRITMSPSTRSAASAIDYEEAQRLADVYSATIDWKKIAEDAGLEGRKVQEEAHNEAAK